MTFEMAVGRVQKIMQDADVEKLGNIAVQIQFTNNDCKGIMYISTRNGELDVQGYDYKDCDAAIEVLYGDLSKILTGKLNGATAIERGAVVVTYGSTDAYMALSGCAKKPAKKPAAKPAKKAAPKAAAKKAPAKKPAAKKTAAKTTK